MALVLNKEKAYIFRITHRDNVKWILENGMHARNGTKVDPSYRNIGNKDLISKRSTRFIDCSPYGTLSDYVPFYFTPYSLMMYNIKTGYGVEQVMNDEIVIFVSSLHKIAEQRIPFLFTNQHAYLKMADYYADLNRLDCIDWLLLQSKNFKHDPDDPGKKDRYQAEALIWKHVPLEALTGICCYSTTVEQEIKAEIEQRSLTLNVAVQRNWYFQ